VVAKGYCTPEQVAAALGLPLTPELAAQLDPVIAAAEADIDAYTGHAWLEPTPVTDEPHLISRPHLNLVNLPVDTVSAVAWLPEGPITATPTVLDPTAYALLSGDDGALWFALSWAPWTTPSGWPGAPWAGPCWLRVSYTTAATVPPEVTRAAIETAATGYRRASDQTTAAAFAAGIRRYSAGQELTVEYAVPTTTSTAAAASASAPLPPAAVAALARWRPALAWA
jgi:hypothetical protein